MSMELTLQILIDGVWERAAVLEFSEPASGTAGACNFEYDFDYLTRWLGKDVPLAAVSLRLPVVFGPTCWPLVGGQPGAYLTHQHVLAALRSVVAPRDWRAVQLEYLRRDLLNLVFGNSDNHGRNMALLTTEGAVRLAPVYDFAPMKMDPEGVTRTTRWETFEAGGAVDWPALLKSFGPEEEYLRAGLQELAGRLRELPDLLMGLGLPEETLRFPGLGLMSTEQKLRDWTLL